MRIDNLPYSNKQTQGAQRREWLRHHAPQHLASCSTCILHGLQRRPHSAAQNTLILGAGTCTEVPLTEVTRASDEVVLVDLDREAMRRAIAEFATHPCGSAFAWLLMTLAVESVPISYSS